MHKFDLFGARPTVTFNGRSRAFSTFGLSLTGIVGTLFILVSIFFSHEMLSRKNPSIVPSRLYEGTYGEPIVFTPDRFRFCMTDPVQGVTWTDETVYSMLSL